jgi:Fe-S cluster assembly scaffold protein SufB
MNKLLRLNFKRSGVRKLYDLEIDEISIVNRPANRRPLLIIKRDDDDSSEKNKGGIMKDLVIKQIEQRARLEHDGDFSKAAAAYFRDHPDYWQPYSEEVPEVNKRAGEDPNYVNALMQSRTEMVAYRDKLDLNKPADLVAAQEKALAENPDLFKRYIAANTIHVGKSFAGHQR